MTASDFLIGVAKRVEAAPMCDAALAKQCRDFATIALNLEHRETVALAVAATKREGAALAKTMTRRT